MGISPNFDIFINWIYKRINMDGAILTKEDIQEVTWGVVNRFLIPEYEKKRKASGNWQDQLSVRVEGNRAIISGTAYTVEMHEGRQPNRDQDPVAIANWARWYGKNVFAKWVEDKGLSINPYAVAYKVAREGYDGDKDLLNVLKSQDVSKYIKDTLGAKIKDKIVNVLINDLIRL